MKEISSHSFWNFSLIWVPNLDFQHEWKWRRNYLIVENSGHRSGDFLQFALFFRFSQKKENESRMKFHFIQAARTTNECGQSIRYLFVRPDHDCCALGILCKSISKLLNHLEVLHETDNQNQNSCFLTLSNDQISK